MERNPKLKSCPFCGSLPYIEVGEIKTLDDAFVYEVDIYCLECNISKTYESSCYEEALASASKQWNIRKESINDK